MALTNNTLPSVLPTRAVPLDINLLFSQAITFTATGYLNNGSSTVQINIGRGRIEGYWVIDLSALDVSSGNETYVLYLLASNDIAFGNGNVEVLASHDWAAATAGRVVPTILGASPTVPIAGTNATRHVIPYSNMMGGFVLQYLQAYLVAGGTTPSMTVTSWITITTGAAC